ncbi:polysaccharide ABC transporter ATP-binding protein [Candidatus Njordibacter sp. Uisw_039]|uniref:ABC transporter ATP-binding protein n=1 Tax=Candidatus Njordibacter sp. Uisw_039 TaxID=3230972 RepID=UPI003D5C3D76
MADQDVVLKATGLSKRYRIGSKVNSDLTVRKQIVDFLMRPVQRFKDIRSLSNFTEEEANESVFWALNDVSFEVRRGEVLGIMGANGAGKSTLLKVLSRIVTPTSGEFWYKGTTSSLLEVGTGFNGELTGRENIYLNGAILGMRRHQIDKVFDEIVDFSGVERFIDTAVKRYSSGMTVRLAFSVAAHLDPDILILDEVLSVGDAQFSQKSMKKMESVAQDGRTVIFVSHSASAVSRLCHRAIFLGAGAITASGSVEQITGIYLGDTVHTRAEKVWDDAVAPSAEGLVKLISVKIVNKQKETLDIVDIRQSLGIEICFQVLRSGKIILPEFQIVNDEENVLFTSIENRTDWDQSPRDPGLYTAIGWLDGNFLTEGRFSVNISLSSPSPRAVFLTENAILYFQVIDSLIGDSTRCDYGTQVPGLISPRLHWS